MVILRRLTYLAMAGVNAFFLLFAGAELSLERIGVSVLALVFFLAGAIPEDVPDTRTGLSPAILLAGAGLLAWGYEAYRLSTAAGSEVDGHTIFGVFSRSLCLASSWERRLIVTD
jgi:hypothetical protein